MRRRRFLQAALGAAAFLPARSLLGSPLSPSAPSEIFVRLLSGGTGTLARVDIAELAASLSGHLLLAKDDGYEQARQVWNGAFNKHPALIARCAGASDVMQAVNFAREHQLLTAVRAGGHSSSGKSTCDGGIVIDLSPMQAVRVDPAGQTVRLEAGTLLGQLDRETAAFGLVTTAGTVSHTGAAGLTLGGGLGRVCRRFGLTCDNLRAADVITANGRLAHAGEHEDPDLLWGLRGGGGNFGVVTSFELQLHEMNPTIFGGVIQWPFEQAREVLSFYADYSFHAPDELNLDVNILWPPGQDAYVEIDVCWCGDLAKGEQVLQPLRRLGRPRLDALARMPYVKLQSSSDPYFPFGRHRYIKSAFTRELGPELIDTILRVFPAQPHGLAIILTASGGAVGRVPPAATAFFNRDARHWLIAITEWVDPAETDERVAFTRRTWKEFERFASGYYINAITAEEESRNSVYGYNLARLMTLKAKYDPGNLFRLNTNVAPGGKVLPSTSSSAS